jgi:two-component system sensor histidine kinase UhpB
VSESPLAGDTPALRAQLEALREAQARLFADLARGSERYRQLARSVMRMQEEERRRIARDLHDGLGQQITAILHQIEPLADHPELPTAAAARAQRAVDLCARALQDTRTLARLLRPKLLDDLGLAAALRWLGRTLADSGGFAVDIECDDGLDAAGTELTTMVFRVVQECLANVARHAGATHALVAVVRRGHELQILVADDGRGFEIDGRRDEGGAARAGGSGMGGIEERVQLFGGRCQWSSAPGEGTQFRAYVPLGSERNP